MSGLPGLAAGQYVLGSMHCVCPCQTDLLCHRLATCHGHARGQCDSDCAPRTVKVSIRALRNVWVWVFVGGRGGGGSMFHVRFYGRAMLTF